LKRIVQWSYAVLQAGTQVVILGLDGSSYDEH
jgi:hypothetical protein